MSNTNANFDMTGILLGQEVRKRRTLDWPLYFHTLFIT